MDVILYMLSCLFLSVMCPILDIFLWDVCLILLSDEFQLYISKYFSANSVDFLLSLNFLVAFHRMWYVFLLNSLFDECLAYFFCLSLTLTIPLRHEVIGKDSSFCLSLNTARVRSINHFLLIISIYWELSVFFCTWGMDCNVEWLWKLYIY